MSNQRVDDVMPGNFLKNTLENETIDFQSFDIEASKYLVRFRYLRYCNDFGNLSTAVVEDCGLRVDVVKHSSHNSNSADENVDESDDFKTR